MTPKDIITFWSSLTEDDWFSNGNKPELDSYIKETYSDIHKKAVAGELNHWVNENDILSLIIILDQFTRHIYRGNKEFYYSCDKLSVALAKQALSANVDVPNPIQRFYFFPFLHSENLQDLYDGKKFAVARNYTGIIQAFDRNIYILETFGRYPFRNVFLGRKTTPEELEWLKSTEGSRRLGRAFPHLNLSDF